MVKTTFNDRKSYLNFVKAWKKEYRKVSSDIVTMRVATKQQMRLSLASGTYQRARISLAKQATNLLIIRIASKIAAGQLRTFNSNSRGADPEELDSQ